MEREADVSRLGVLVVAGVMLIAACGGGDDTTDGSTAGSAAGANAPSLDPCELAGDAVLEAYFGDVFAGEPGEAGPIDTCRWRDDNANSLLIQVATDFPLTKPDPCDGCVDLSFGDDGFASESPLQSSASFVSGSNWYSVTATGFGDDASSIASLAETIFTNAGN